LKQRADVDDLSIDPIWPGERRGTFGSEDLPASAEVLLVGVDCGFRNSSSTQRQLCQHGALAAIEPGVQVNRIAG
jgi:hypothetical protein